ncbi:MAG: type II toxin-antitoxin system mRNA interferase toxin, RelE/StbE family [Bacteriovoracaceae bacterium]|jgi:proteic killer suppression protein
MKISFSSKAEKQLKKLPRNILENLMAWITFIEKDGLEKIRQIRGYRDEALKGERKGQRSSRLNKAYRVIYKEDGTILEIIEVNNHEY